MSAETPRQKPVKFGLEWVLFLEGTAIVPPPGTMAPPRSDGVERKPLPPGVVRGWEYVERESKAEVPPPGTMAPPGSRAWRERRVRIAIPATTPAAEIVADLLRRVQAAIDGLATDPGQLDALRRAAEQLPRAG